MIGHTIFIFTMGIAVATITYDSFARAIGWPIGEILSRDISWPKLIAFVSILWTFGKALFLFPWWSPIIIVLAGFLLAFLLVSILKSNVQYLCILGILPASFFMGIYQSEVRPFGFLHSL